MRTPSHLAHLGDEADQGVGDNLAHLEVHDTVDLVHALENHDSDFSSKDDF